MGGCCSLQNCEAADDYDNFRNQQFSLRPLPQGACYGEYRCNYCNRFWKSALSWKGDYKICKSCHRRVYPENQRALRPSDKKHGEGEHPRELCQKCQTLGYYCGKYNSRLARSRS